MDMQDVAERLSSVIKDSCNQYGYFLGSLVFHGSVIFSILIWGAWTKIDWSEVYIPMTIVFEVDKGAVEIEEKTENSPLKMKKKALEKDSPQIDSLHQKRLIQTTEMTRIKGESVAMKFPTRSLEQSLQEGQKGHQPAPLYPDLCRLKGITGTVQFRLQVDSAGRVQQVHCLTPVAHNLLRDAATEALERWNLGAYKTSYDVFVPVTFTLEDG